jgi:ABC-type multidrug transport system fused ATPase/permease subunit
VSIETREAKVGDLARDLRRNETILPGAIENPFTVQDERSTLNPNGNNFRAKDWIKMVLAIESLNPEKYPQVQAGIAFKDLSVHGFGSPTDYQKTVLNIFLELGSLARWLVGMKKQKIQILRDFDGLVRSGEMLVVLGRPGSGCSTFLKTIAGEMNGINTSENTTLNYQGVTSIFQQSRISDC